MPTPEELAAVWSTMPFAQTIGSELLEADAAAVRARVAWDESRCTAGGMLHGGALMSLADSAAAVCAFLNLPEGAAGTTTVESKTNFLRGVREGAAVRNAMLAVSLAKQGHRGGERGSRQREAECGGLSRTAGDDWRLPEPGPQREPSRQGRSPDQQQRPVHGALRPLPRHV
jgi:uncharacterized protein (TIGR00369 family)